MLAVFHREHLLQFWSQSDDFAECDRNFLSQFIQEMHIDLKQAIPIFMHLKDNPAIHITEERTFRAEHVLMRRSAAYCASDDIHRLANIQRCPRRCSGKILAIHQNKVPEAAFAAVAVRSFSSGLWNCSRSIINRNEAWALGAERLHITPKYLSSVIKEVSGKSAEWIDQYVILEAKALLRYSGLSIQEIAYELNFSTQSFFGKYFKHHTGISPSAYKHK